MFRLSEQQPRSELSRVPRHREFIISWPSDVILKHKFVTCLGGGGGPELVRGSVLPWSLIKQRAKPWGFLRKQNTPLCTCMSLKWRGCRYPEKTASREYLDCLFCLFSTLCALAWHSLASDLKSWVCRQFANYDSTRPFWLLLEWVGESQPPPWPPMAICDLEQNLWGKYNCLNYCSFICF